MSVPTPEPHFEKFMPLACSACLLAPRLTTKASARPDPVPSPYAYQLPTRPPSAGRVLMSPSSKSSMMSFGPYLSATASATHLAVVVEQIQLAQSASLLQRKPTEQSLVAAQAPPQSMSLSS